MKASPMKQSGSSIVRLLVLLAVLVAVILGTYWKVPGAREMMDDKLPFVKNTLARFGAEIGRASCRERV